MYSFLVWRCSASRLLGGMVETKGPDGAGVVDKGNSLTHSFCSSILPLSESSR